MKPKINSLLALVIAGITPTLANAESLEFTAKLSGAQEVVFDSGGNFIPGGTNTSATGKAHVDFEKFLAKVVVNVRIEGLVGTFAAAHFHCGRAGTNGPVAFGLVNPGPLSFDGEGIRGSLDNTNYTGADCVPVVGRPVNNIAALALAMQDGLIYINVHSSAFPAGEIRGQMLEHDGDKDFPGKGKGLDKDKSNKHDD